MNPFINRMCCICYSSYFLYMFIKSNQDETQCLLFKFRVESRNYEISTVALFRRRVYQQMDSR